MPCCGAVSLFAEVPVAACLQEGQRWRRTRPGCYCTFAGQAVGGDSRKTLSAHVTESGAGVGARVPVMHPWEMFHVKLGHLETRRQGRFAKQENRTTCRSYIMMTEISNPLFLKLKHFALAKKKKKKTYIRFKQVAEWIYIYFFPPQNIAVALWITFIL